MVKKIKQFLCRHNFKIVNIEPMGGYAPAGGLLVEVEYICSKCEKTTFRKGLDSDL